MSSATLTKWLGGGALTLASGLLLSTPLTDASADSRPHPLATTCDGGVSLVITADERFDPLVQQLLVKQQLDRHPVIDRPRFLIIPHRDNGHLTETQIRYLEQLLGRAGR